jgi:hypothetical protein
MYQSELISFIVPSVCYLSACCVVCSAVADQPRARPPPGGELPPSTTARALSISSSCAVDPVWNLAPMEPRRTHLSLRIELYLSG